MTLRWSTFESFPGNTSSETLIAWRPCPLCGHLEDRSVYQYDAFQFYMDDAAGPKRARVRTARCVHCNTLFMNPAYSPVGFDRLFAEAGASYGSHIGSRHAEQAAWLTSRGLLDAGAVVLDAGCYDGAFLGALSPAVRRIGVDVDRAAIERGRAQRAGVEFVLGDFERFTPPAAPSVVTMFHVLEHLPRPAEVLRRVRAVAAPDAALVVEVPILENGGTNDINGFFSVQHLTHFSRHTLEAVLQAGGWQTQERDEQPGYNGCRVLARPALTPPCAPLGDPGDVARSHELVATFHTAHAAAAHRAASVPPDEPCVIWGGGAHTEVLHQVTSFFTACPSRPLAIVDSDPLKQGRTWRGIPIQCPAEASSADWTRTWLLVSSYGGTGAIAAAARSLGVPAERIVTLYETVRTY